MQNFSLTIDAMKFDVILPENFNDVVEGIAEAFDFAEQDAEDGVIPFNRRGLMINKRLTVVSNVPEAEMYVEDKLTAKLSRHVTNAIGRKCRVSGVFALGDRPSNGRFETTFEITFVTLT